MERSSIDSTEDRGLTCSQLIKLVQICCQVCEGIGRPLLTHLRLSTYCILLLNLGRDLIS